MNIIDIKDKLPLKVKIGSGFKLEESFDQNTIIKVCSVELDNVYDGERCFKVNVAALASDYTHNSSVAKSNWYDGNGDSCLTIYEHKELESKNGFNKKIHDFYDTIYVMESEEAFEDIFVMTRGDFSELCRTILRIKGKNTGSEHSSKHHSSSTGELLQYSDETIVITGSRETLSLTVFKVDNGNPVVYIDDKGDNFRSHGEQKFLYDHVKSLIIDIIT